MGRKKKEQNQISIGWFKLICDRILLSMIWWIWRIIVVKERLKDQLFYMNSWTLLFFPEFKSAGSTKTQLAKNGNLLVVADKVCQSDAIMPEASLSSQSAKRFSKFTNFQLYGFKFVFLVVPGFRPTPSWSDVNKYYIYIKGRRWILGNFKEKFFAYIFIVEWMNKSYIDCAINRNYVNITAHQTHCSNQTIDAQQRQHAKMEVINNSEKLF